MKTSETTNTIFDALAKAQAEFPAIPRNRTVTVTTSKGSYKFAYAPFEDILRVTKPVLANHGLAFTQGADGDSLTTVVTHQSGEWFSHQTAILNTGGTAQGYGSALTYARRYGYCGALGIQADDDDDGNAADGNTITAQTKDNGKHKAPTTETMEEHLAALPVEEREHLRRVAVDIEALIEEKRDADAWAMAEATMDAAKKHDAANDTDKTLYIQMGLWSLLGSKARSAIKRVSATKRTN